MYHSYTLCGQLNTDFSQIIQKQMPFCYFWITYKSINGISVENLYKMKPTNTLFIGTYLILKTCFIHKKNIKTTFEKLYK